MARTDEAVGMPINQSCLGAAALKKTGYRPAWCRLILLMSLSQNVLSQAPEAADVMIAEKPGALSMLNRYEQQLTDEERDGFPPYSPLEIVEKDGFLGDQITPAMRVFFRKKPFYILKEKDGTLGGQKACGYLKIFSGCKPVGDTMRIAEDRAVLFAERYPSDGRRIYLDKGDMIKRLYSYREHVLSLLAGTEERYGWCSASAGPSLEAVVEEEKNAGHEIETALEDSIAVRIETANRTYKEYFEYFNRSEGREMPVPQWESEGEDGRLRFRMTQAERYAHKLRESTLCLVRDLERILRGEPFAVVCSDDVIEIRER